MLFPTLTLVLALAGTGISAAAPHENDSRLSARRHAEETRVLASTAEVRRLDARSISAAGDGFGGNGSGNSNTWPSGKKRGPAFNPNSKRQQKLREQAARQAAYTSAAGSSSSSGADGSRSSNPWPTRKTGPKVNPNSQNQARLRKHQDALAAWESAGNSGPMPHQGQFKPGHKKAGGRQPGWTPTGKTNPKTGLPYKKTGPRTKQPPGLPLTPGPPPSPGTLDEMYSFLNAPSPSLQAPPSPGLLEIAHSSYPPSASSRPPPASSSRPNGRFWQTTEPPLAYRVPSKLGPKDNL